MWNKIYWIGIQESEINYTNNLFNGSITIFGSNENNNYSYDKTYSIRYDYNIDNPEWINFVNITALKIIEKDPTCKFLLYYPMEASNYIEEIKIRLIGINDLIFLDLLDNKINCKEWLCNDVPTIPYVQYKGTELVYLLKNRQIEKEIVIQGEYSCGGNQTWLCNSDNYLDLIKKIDLSQTYTISPYIKNNISLNIHLVIFKNDILFLPGSIQIIRNSSSSFEYCGADFIQYQYLSQIIKDKIMMYAMKIGKRLQNSGYLGVCGIDFLASLENVYFLEINPRFQSSSFLINYAFNDCNKKISIQLLHLLAFSDNVVMPLSELKINYSYYKFTYSNKIDDFKFRYIAEKSSKNTNIIFIDDNISYNYKFEENTYLYKLIFKRCICSISPDFKLIIHPNLLINSCICDFKNIYNQLQELKIMLLSHGIIISKHAKEFLNQKEGINHLEFEAVDLILNDDYYISVPYNFNLSQISPFEIDILNDRLYLYYFGIKILPVNIRGIDVISNRTTTSGIKYSDIAYLGHDRLRIYHRLGCYYKKIGKGCKFCDMDNDHRKLDLCSIKEVIKDYKNNDNIKHYLIGGGSEPINNDLKNIYEIINYLGKKKLKPIYLMSTPILDINELKKLKSCGVTEVAFNIEIFDRKLAKEYMPGKGLISLEYYVESLINAVKVWGNQGNVRSILVVGLETKSSLLAGIERICKIGVSPILSLLKPIESTPLNYLLPPNDEEILEIVHETINLCNKYQVPFGPICKYCEDNTLKITIHS